MKQMINAPLVGGRKVYKEKTFKIPKRIVNSPLTEWQNFLNLLGWNYVYKIPEVFLALTPEQFIDTLLVNYIVDYFAHDEDGTFHNDGPKVFRATANFIKKHYIEEMEQNNLEWNDIKKKVSGKARDRFKSYQDSDETSYLSKSDLLVHVESLAIFDTKNNKNKEDIQN
jgi:hypothetical protein